MTANAVRLPAIYTSDGLAPQGVLARRDRLKVCRVDTARIATEMVHLKTIWNRTDERRIREPVGLHESPLRATKETVTSAGFLRACPRPATVR